MDPFSFLRKAGSVRSNASWEIGILCRRDPDSQTTGGKTCCLPLYSSAPGTEQTFNACLLKTTSRNPKPYATKDANNSRIPPAAGGVWAGHCCSCPSDPSTCKVKGVTGNMENTKRGGVGWAGLLRAHLHPPPFMVQVQLFPFSPELNFTFVRCTYWNRNG